MWILDWLQDLVHFRRNARLARTVPYWQGRVNALQVELDKSKRMNLRLSSNR